MKMGYRAATDLSIGPFFTKFYGEKDGDTPRIRKSAKSRFMKNRKIEISWGVPYPMVPRGDNPPWAKHRFIRFWQGRVITYGDTLTVIPPR